MSEPAFRMFDRCPRGQGGCGAVDYQPLPRRGDGPYLAKCLRCGKQYVRAVKQVSAEELQQAALKALRRPA